MERYKIKEIKKEVLEIYKELDRIRNYCISSSNPGIPLDEFEIEMRAAERLKSVDFSPLKKIKRHKDVDNYNVALLLVGMNRVCYINFRNATDKETINFFKAFGGRFWQEEYNEFIMRKACE